MNSRIPGFYKLSLDERLRKIAELVDLTSDDIKILKSFGEINPQVLDAMIENVIGVYPLPYGVAVNFRINGRDYIVPMVVEESSVVAAASNAARLLRDGDGIESISTDQIMIGQIQLIKIDDLDGSAKTILDNKERLLEVANMQSKTLRRLGGGAKDIIVRRLETRMGDMLIVHIYVDVKDAMGANIVNTMCEALGPVLEELTGGKALLKILSNYTDRRIVKVKARVSRDVIGDDVIENIEYASAFAESDPYRAVTHNKGIMNGVIAVALATGQDTRAIESAAHAYASRDGKYRPLSRWYRDSHGDLIGEMEIPIPVGVVGGATKVHPTAMISLKILGVETARELAEVMAAVGLAQNFSALKALATEGIQKGHMKLHARNLAIMAGAEGDIVDKIAEEMIKEGNIRFNRAIELLKEYQSKYRR